MIIALRSLTSSQLLQQLFLTPYKRVLNFGEKFILRSGREQIINDFTLNGGTLIIEPGALLTAINTPTFLPVWSAGSFS